MARYTAPSKLTPAGTELERALLVELRKLQDALALAPANVRDPRGSSPARPQPGDFVRVASGQSVILPHPRTSRGQSVYVLAEGVTTLTSISGLVNDQEAIVITVSGLMVAVSSGVGWHVVGVRVEEGHITTGAVTTFKIADSAVTGAKLAANSVSASKVFKADSFTWTGVQAFDGVFDVTLSAQADNLVIGAVNVVRIVLSGAQTLTGMVPTADGQLVILFNRGPTADLTIAHETTSSTSSRFNCPGGVNFVLQQFGAVPARYDGLFNRWNLLSR